MINGRQRKTFAQERERDMMGPRTMILLSITTLAGIAPQAKAALDLGTAGNVAVLAGTTVTNTGPSVIGGGNLGVNPGTAITGLPPGIISSPFTTHSADAVA